MDQGNQSEQPVQTETIGNAVPDWDELGGKLIAVIRAHAPPDDQALRREFGSHLDRVQMTGTFTGCLVSLNAGEAYIPGQNVGAGLTRKS